MVKAQIPEAGDVVWLNFSPTQGHEQSGKRPAVVISEKAFAKINGLCTVCPITSQVKGYTNEVSVNTKKIQGVVLVDQFKTIDVCARSITKIARVSGEDLKEIRHRASLVLGMRM